MMSYFYLILFLYLFDYTTSIFDNQKKNAYIYQNSSNYQSFELEFGKCISKYILKNKGRESVLCILNVTEIYTNETKIFLDSIRYNNSTYILDFVKGMFYENNMQILFKILEDLLTNESNTIIDDLFEIIKNHTSNKIIEYIRNLLIEPKDGIQYTYVFEQLYNIFNIPGVYKLFNYTYNIYRDDFIDIIEIITRDTKFSNLFNMLKDFIRNNQDTLFDFLYNLTANFKDGDRIVIIIRDVILENIKNKNCTLLDSLMKVANNSTILECLSKTIELDTEVSNRIMSQLLSKQNLVIFAVKFFYNQTFVEDFTNIILNIKNNTYTNENLPKFIKFIYGDNKEYYTMLLNITVTVMENIIKERQISEFISKSFSKIMKNFIFVEPFETYKISQSCTFLFNYTFYIDLHGNMINFRNLYEKKLIIESTKNKNDFLTYENCLSGNYTSSYSEIYDIKPIFLISLINDAYNQNKFKDSVLFEKYNYLFSLCLPYGINKTDNKPLCSIDDYNLIIKIFLQLSHNMDNATVDSLILDSENLEVKTEDYLYFGISFIIIMLPLLIKLFLFLYGKIMIKRYDKKGIINKLTLENDNININNEPKKADIIEESKKNNSLKYIAPNWYKFLNDCFDIIKNGSYLFNISLNEANFNDFNGISYIKGILGISMLLNIFGQTFFILLNTPEKILGIYQFYITLYNPFYIILFIGLRYCPRIIFSCSGYTLIYKYLCFIEKGENFYFLRFLILQSYKYILLILVSLYLRLSFYYINIIFRNMKTPTLELLKFKLEKRNKNYFYNLFSFLFYNLNQEEFFDYYGQSEIQYLYLPINEIFFFIFGTSLISIGYKFKLRIDIIIIIIIIFVYGFKIISYFLAMQTNQIYSTLYFYLYGYGAIMLIPFFNLPSFLIGMYFGLVNYTIQRGVNNSYKENTYTKIETLEEIKKEKLNLNKEKNAKLHDVDTILNNKYNTFTKNEKIDRKLTYNFESSSLSIQGKSKFKLDNISSDISLENNKSIDEITFLEEDNEILKEMPFLKSIIAFTEYHRRNQDKIFLKIILFIFLLFVLFFIIIHYISILFFIEKNINSNIKIIDNLSLDKLIPNHFLNIVYVIDIEIVIIFINWACFYMHFRGGQINDFLNHSFWSFFIKSYFSYILVLSPCIIYLFYNDETVIKVTIYNIFLYSLISIILVFVMVTIFYSFYEYPLKKIFKSIKITITSTNLEADEDEDEESEI